MSALSVVIAIGLAALSGLQTLLWPRTSRVGERLATLLLLLACVSAVIGAVAALTQAAPTVWRWDWSIPGGELLVRMDAVSAVFVLQVFVGALLGSIYGLAYWRQLDHQHNGRKLRLFYGLVTAGMATVVVAGNSILFLFGWEVMALAAFLALTTVDEDPHVREVGYLYLAATHAGTLCLFALFSLLYAQTGSFDFGVANSVRDASVGVMLLALVGFGLKAGIIPLHVWLPGAHARAPTHVSALMSGILLKIGIYGLVRVGSMIAAPPMWCGVLVLCLGGLSAVLGVLMALGQHDLKRLLAYHSVENIGIIFLGLGLALLGKSVGRSELVVLGLAGALLHVWNHGLFKALLFFSAGAVISATGTREIDQLGGLLRKMPWTALFFLVGATAICGLPPLNGFVSELLIYLALARSLLGSTSHLSLITALAIPVLAVTGAFAAACFAKAFGIVFLGEARSARVERVREAPKAMLAPMAVLATLCVVIGAGPVLIAPALDRAVAAWIGPRQAGQMLGEGSLPLLADLAPLQALSWIAFALITVVALIAVYLRRRMRAHVVRRVGTWDCGYVAPAASMQYTASSFADTLIRLFRFVLWPRESLSCSSSDTTPSSLRMGSFKLHSDCPDVVLDRLLLPAVAFVHRVLARIRRVQGGSIQLYLAYIAAVIVLLLLWRS